MSKNIDTNIVEMKFDNAQFEKNCQQSMSTLDKLKEKINNTNGDGLSKLGESAKNIDLSNIEKTLDTVNNKFSILGVMGATIISEMTKSLITMAKNVITAVPNIIKEKGWTRAMNIEQAKFQLEGLGVAWKNVADDIDYAVSGTAYGLDAAAKACSQLVASGVQAGDAMKEALRGISGVAAMTNSEYEEIAPIFTTVAGQGKLMTMQLRQLESRGLNAAAVLGESLGKTEAEIREMVTDGEINFATFSHAMDMAFGEHAKDANKTFEGVIKNIKAALARIGADFFSPVIEEEGPIVKALQVLRQKIVDIKDAIQPTVKRWKEFVKEFGYGARDILSKLNVNFFGNLVEGFANILTGVWQTLKAIGGAFLDVFGSEGNKSLQSFADGWEKFTRTLILNKQEMADLREVFRGVFSVLDLLGTALKEVLAAFVGLSPASVGFRQVLLRVLAVVSQLVQEFVEFVKNSQIIQVTIQVISIGLKALLLVILKTAEAFSLLFTKASAMEGLQVIFKVLATAAYLLVGALSMVVEKLIEIGKAAISGNVQSLGKLGDVILFIRNGAIGLYNALKDCTIVKVIIGGIAEAFIFLKDAVDNFFGRGKENQVSNNIREIKDEIVPLAGETKKFDKNLKGIDKTVKSFNKTIKDSTSTTKTVSDTTSKAVGGIGKAFKDTTEKVQGFNAAVPISKVVAIAFVSAIVIALLNLSRALNSVGQGVANVGSFLFYLKTRGLIGLLTGNEQFSRTPNHILDIAAALGALAISLYAMSKIPSDKLEESLMILAKMAAGFAGLLATMTLLEKFLGFSGALDYIGVAMLEVAASITVVGAAMKLISTIDMNNVENVISTFVVMVGGMAALGIVLGKYGNGLNKMGVVFVGMAVSMLILVKALDQLNSITLAANGSFAELGKKLAGLGVIALEMTAIAVLCDKLGGKSFMRLATSALALTAAIKLVLAIKNILTPEDYQSLKDFAERLWNTVLTITTIVASLTTIAVIITGAIAIPKLIAAGLGKILGGLKEVTDSIGKIRKYQDYHKKALNTLATSALVVAITGAIATLSLVLLLLVKADLSKNMDALHAGLGAMVTMFIAMGSTIMIIGKALGPMKGAAGGVLATLIAFAGVIISTVGIAAYLYGVIADENRGLWDKIGEIGGMLGVLLGVLMVIRNFCKSASLLKGVKFDASTTAGIVALVASVAVIAGSVIALTKTMDSFGSVVGVIASLAMLGLAMEALVHFTKLLSQVKRINQGTFKAINSLTVAIATISASLVLISRFGGDGPRILLAMTSLGLIFAEFGVIARLLGQVKLTEASLRGVKYLVAALVAIGGSLIGLTMVADNSANIIAATMAMGIIFGEFGAIAYALSKVKFSATSVPMIHSLIGVLVAAGASLIGLTLVGSNSEAIKNAVISLSLILVEVLGVSAIISKINYTPQSAVGVVSLIAMLLSSSISLIALTRLGDMTKIYDAVIGLGLVMAEMAGVAFIINAIQVKPAALAALVVLAGDMLVAAVSLSMLAQYDWERIKYSAIALGGTLAAYGGVAVILGMFSADSLLGAVTLTILAADLLIAAGSLSMLAQYDWKNIEYAAYALVGTMTAVSVLSIILGPLIPIVGLGAAAIAALGAALIPAAFAMKIGSEAIGAFSLAMINFATAAGLFVPSFLQLLDGLGKYSGQYLEIAGGMIALGAASAILAPGLMLLAAASAAMGASIGGIREFAKELPKLTAGFDSLSRLNLAALLTNIVGIIAACLGFAAVSPIIIVASGAMTVLAGAMTALATAMMLFAKAVAEAHKIFTEVIPEWVEAGKNLMSGLYNGILGAAKPVIDLVSSIGKGIINTFKSVLDIHSPSKVMEWIGEMTGIGFENGLGLGLDGVDEMLSGELEGYLDIMGGSQTQQSAYDAGYAAGEAYLEGQSDVAEEGKAGVAKSWTDIVNEAGAAGMSVGEYWGQQTAKSMLEPMQKAMEAMRNAMKFSSSASAYHGPGSDTDLVAKASPTGDGYYEEWQQGYNDAVNGVTKANEALSASMDKVGGSAGKAKDKITDLADAFKAISKSEKVTMEEMNNNMINNIKAHVQWASDVRQVVLMGYDKATVDWVKSMGVAGHETVKALKNASADEFLLYNQMLPQWLKIDEVTDGVIKGQYGEYGEAYAMAMMDAFNQTFDQNIADTVQKAVSPFEEFDNKTELTGTKLLQNMNSQLDGIRKWGENLQTLIARGVDDGIISKLAEMGPASYEIVNAMTQMTDNQLAEMNDVWAQQMQLGVEVAKGIAAKYQEVGMMVTQGLEDGVDLKAIGDKGTEIGNELDKKTRARLGIHSPSTVYTEIGKNVAIGLKNGIGVSMHMPENQAIIMATNVITETTRIINRSEGVKIGESLVEGMIAGLKKREQELYDTAYQIAYNAWLKAKEAVESHSPSKKFMRLGEDMIRGEIIGLQNQEGNLYGQIEEMGTTTVEQMASVISQIAENVNGEMSDIVPVIKPRLDLSEVQNGKSFISSMFGGTSVALADSVMVNRENVGSAATETPTPFSAGNKTIIFNQTNNSPQNIDPYESYRLGRLGAQQMGGAFA